MRPKLHSNCDTYLLTHSSVIFTFMSPKVVRVLYSVPHPLVTRPPGCCGRLWPSLRWTATPPQLSLPSLTELKQRHQEHRQMFSINTAYTVYTVYYHCLNQGANFLQSIILIIIHVMHDCKKIKQGKLHSAPGAVPEPLGGAAVLRLLRFRAGIWRHAQEVS